MRRSAPCDRCVECRHVFFGPCACRIGGTVRSLRENPRATIVIDGLASVDPWQPRGIKVRGRAVLEENNGRPRIRILPKVIWSWGLNPNEPKRFATIERRNVT